MHKTTCNMNTPKATRYPKQLSPKATCNMKTNCHIYIKSFKITHTKATHNMKATYKKH